MSRQHWAHHGIAALPGGDLVTFGADNRTMRVISPDGRLLAEVGTPIRCAHAVIPGTGLDASQMLWVADTASSASPGPDGTDAYAPDTQHGRVVALRLDGTVERQLPLPPLPVYQNRRYEPTAVLPIPVLGQIWVADGYGEGLVHRYTAAG